MTGMGTGRRLLVCATLALGALGAPADEVRLKYLGRYIRSSAGPDHLMGVECIGGHYALVSSNMAIALLDLEALTVAGSQSYIYWLGGIDVYTTHTRPDGYCYANLRQGGLVVVYVDLTGGTLTKIREIAETDVFYDKMQVVGDRLYVAAHAYGIRIFDLTDPADPVLVGSLTTGFDDAFAIAVSGQTAYVADGAGGLKIVDLTNEAAPVIVAGENPDTAPGTAEDVLVIGEHVYVASGGAGVAVYPLNSLAPRTLYNTPDCAIGLARVGNHLAVADLGGLQIFEIQPGGALRRAAREKAVRNYVPVIGFSLRRWHGVSAWGDTRVLAADWTTMDAYELVDPATDTQPDVTASLQRFRFAPTGGTGLVRLTNDGSGPLTITSIQSSKVTFTTEPNAAELAPGESVAVTVTYAGGTPGDALIHVQSNDPDEPNLPIQAFGQTSYLDPTEPALPFTLEAWTYDHATKQYTYETFDLAAQAGKVVYLEIYVAW